MIKKYWIGVDSGLAVYNSISRKLIYDGQNIEQEPVIEKPGKIKSIGCYGIGKKKMLVLELAIKRRGPIVLLRPEK